MRHWSNNAITTLSSTISAVSTNITVQDNSRFPDQTVGGFDFTGGDYFLLTLKPDPQARTPNEIVRVTDHVSGTTYEVTRAQEGTTAMQWLAGAAVVNQFTAAVANEFESGVGTPSTVVTNSTLAGDGSGGDPLGVNFGPNVFGLGAGAIPIGDTHDLDELTGCGWWRWVAGSTPENSPTSGGGMLMQWDTAGVGRGQLVLTRDARLFHRIESALTVGLWGQWRQELNQVAINNTLVGTGNPSSPLGVNTDVFETQIHTDGSLGGDGSSGNFLRVNPIVQGTTLADNSGNLSIDITEPNFRPSETVVNIVGGGGGADFDLTIDTGIDGSVVQGKKVHIVNTSPSAVTIIGGTGVNWIDSPAGSAIDIPPGAGLVTFLVVNDFVSDIGLAFQGGVVATP